MPQRSVTVKRVGQRIIGKLSFRQALGGVKDAPGIVVIVYGDERVITMRYDRFATRRDVLRILGIPGSLRRHSYNHGLLAAAQELAPAGVGIEIFDITPIPFYNSDVEEWGDPEPVRQFKARIRAADALLIATPEYNYSIPGVLKNAIDWASRPATSSVLYHKPIALMGASTGNGGTVRAQLALRQVFTFTKSHVLIEPELLVNRARERFDAEGNLTDEETRQHVRSLVEALVNWTCHLQAEGIAPVAEMAETA
jgi:chromate reductase